MVTWRRVILVVIVLVIVAGAYSAYLAWRTEHELRDAQDAVTSLRASLDDGDTAGRDAAVTKLTAAADAAKGHTDGFWWGAMTHVPVLGDDAGGVRDLSASLQLLADDALTPLLDASDNLDGLLSGGGIDLDRLQQLDTPVASAHRALDQADGLVAGQDSSGYVSALRTRFDTYARTVSSLDRGLAAADKALDVAPTMLGADGPRDYLFVFQNNAEVRATGGVPGSWSLIHAEDGKLSITQQGSDGDFTVYPPNAPATAISTGERKVYGPEIARYFQDPGFTPDFPRAAQIFRGFWDGQHRQTPIDGVIALDPVGLSYLLDGLTPVTVSNGISDVTLTSSNAVSELLNQIYIDQPDPSQQDLFFQNTAKDVFNAATGQVASPLRLLEGFARASTERRFLVAPFRSADAEKLAGTRVTGALSGDDGSTPHVDIGLNDSTASKMSYYLRYNAQVQPMSCSGGIQQLTGSLSLSQTITPADAAKLPAYITGDGTTGVDPGNQVVIVRIYGPYGGTFGQVNIDGKRQTGVTALMLDGRPVLTLALQVEAIDDTVVTWGMSTGPGQDGDVAFDMTPSVVPGDQQRTFASAC